MQVDIGEKIEPGRLQALLRKTFVEEMRILARDEGVCVIPRSILPSNSSDFPELPLYGAESALYVLIGVFLFLGFVTSQEIGACEQIRKQCQSDDCSRQNCRGFCSELHVIRWSKIGLSRFGMSKNMRMWPLIFWFPASFIRYRVSKTYVFYQKNKVRHLVNLRT